MLMADSSTRFSSISIFPVSERRRKWPSARIAKGIRVSVTLAPEADFARSAVGRERIPCRVCDVSGNAAQGSVPCVNKDQKNSSPENEQRPEALDLSLENSAR